KKTVLATESGRADVADDRRTWRNHRQPRMREEPDRLVFLDETATTTKMTRLRGRAKRGQRFKAKAPFGHWGTQTFIAALRCDGLTAPWIIKGAMNKRLFETYVETQLAPTLQPGDIVILDNLSSHKKRKGQSHPQRKRSLVPFSAPLQPRPQPHRDGLRQAQGPSQTHRRAHHRGTLESRRLHL
ncbi:transposase, partial [Azospirillum griseum]